MTPQLELRQFVTCIIFFFEETQIKLFENAIAFALKARAVFKNNNNQS